MATVPLAAPAGRGRARKPLSAYAWPIAMTALVILTFFFYENILPNLTDNIASGVQRWGSLTSINECMIYVIMALGLNVVVGYAGLLDLGYVAFWAIGAYVGAYLMSSFVYQIKKGIHFGSAITVARQPGIHVSFWLVLLVGAFVCAFFGILIGAPTLRLRSDYLALVTLGFGEIIPQVFYNGDSIGGLNLTNGARGITPVDPIGTGALSNIPGVNPVLTVGQSSLPYKFLIYAALAAVCVFISLRIREGRLGRSWLAIREDELAANMMGVPLVKAKLSAYAVGAFFGGLGGVAYATHVGGALADSFQYSKSIFVLIMVVLGGMGNVWGVIIGAVALSWINNTGLQQFGNTFNGRFSTHIDFPSYNFLLFGILLVLMMLFRREGILPERRTKQILREPARTELEAIGSDVEAAQAVVDSESESEPVADSAPTGAPS